MGAVEIPYHGREVMGQEDMVSQEKHNTDSSGKAQTILIQKVFALLKSNTLNILYNTLKLSCSSKYLF